MKYADAVSFRRAMEARLNNAASMNSTPINRLRRTVVLERFLARLLEAAPDRWLLKGGVALEFRFPNLARATKDLEQHFHNHRPIGSEHTHVSRWTSALTAIFKRLIERSPGFSIRCSP
jgi:hypothetical protein